MQKDLSELRQLVLEALDELESVNPDLLVIASLVADMVEELQTVQTA